MHLDFCAVCGRRDSLEHHHFVPRSSGGSDDETNALTLCGACHMTLHELRSTKRLNHAATIRVGIERARANGTQLGRPTVDSEKELMVRGFLRAGTGILKTAKLAGVGSSVVQRIRREMMAAA